MSLAHYLLQVNIYLIIFYCFYQLLLAKETYFVLNRVYLMAAGILSFTIPFLRFEWFSKQEVSQKIYVSVDQLNALVGQVHIVNDDATEFNWGNIIVIIYLAGIVFFVGKLIYQLLAIQKMFTHIASGAAFSFFRRKVITANVPNIATVHLHEDIHIKQLHSVDVIFFELIGILTWFNPIVYAYKKTIKNIHEYLADEAAAKFQGDKEAYAMLLLSHAFGIKPHTLTNNFYKKSLIKKRILMLHKQRSKKTAILKYGLFVPLFALTLVLSSATIRKNDQILAVAEKIPLDYANKLVGQAIESPLTMVNLVTPPPPKTTVEKLSPNTVTVNPTTTETDNSGAWNNFYSFLGNEIKYPAGAVKKNLQGNSIINFAVKRGRITDVAIETELGEGCDEEVINNISAFDDYFGKDGSYSLKVTFKLQNSNAPFKNENATTPNDFTALPSIVITAFDESAASEKVYNFVSLSSPPTYPGGVTSFYDFLSKNIKYPTLAAENDIEGNVFVSFTVEKGGSLTDIKVDRRLGFGTDEEAIRVLKLAKRWNPGLVDGKAVRVKYNIPIKFALGPDVKESKTNVIASVKLKSYANSENPPLVVIDNEINDASVLSDLNANNIKTVEVLRAANAIATYGKRAENGAIVITSKKAKNPTATILNKN